MSHDQPTVIVDSGSSYSFKDVTIPGFNFRFVKQDDNWVCSMPEWLLKEAIGVAATLNSETTK